MGGSTRKVVEKYLESKDSQVPEVTWEFENAPGNEVAKLRAVRVLNEHGQARYYQNMDQSITLELEFWVRRPNSELNPSFQIYNQEGICLFAVSNLHDSEWESRLFETGLYRSVCCIPAHYLNEGQHYVSAIILKDKKKLEVVMENIVSFFVHDHAAARGGYTGTWIGVVRPLLPWSIERVGALS